MAEITQADRDAACKFLRDKCSTGAQMLLGSRPDAIFEAFARHREKAEAETVAKIVAWLREQDKRSVDDDDTANAIEAGGLQAMTALHRLIDWLLAPAFRWAGKRWED